MATSPEYPDLPWMPPRSWTDANRTSVQLVVMHTTEGSAHSSSAEDGANYDQERTDGTSTHYFHDSSSTIQCVRTADQAHAARTQGNRRGIQHELCTKSGSANWGDSYHQAMLRRAAKQAARDAKKWGIPVRKLSSSQVADGMKGFCGHVEITYAFPQDNGTHTDPGPNFPWSQFLAMVNEEIDGDDMTKTEFMQWMEEFHAKTKVGFATNMPDGIGGAGPAWDVLGDTAGRAKVALDGINEIKGLLTTLTGKDFTDEQAIVEGVLAGLAGADGLAETIADAVYAAFPPDIATDIANQILAKAGQAMVDAAGDTEG